MTCNIQLLQYKPTLAPTLGNVGVHSLNLSWGIAYINCGFAKMDFPGFTQAYHMNYRTVSLQLVSVLRT